MSAFHLNILRQVANAEVKPSVSPNTLTGPAAALYAKLRADKWPWIGVRCLTFVLDDGTRYTPTIVTVDEGVVAAWEAGGEIPAPHLLPVGGRAVIYFTSARRVGAGWVETDVMPLRRLEGVAA